ncbi:MAG: AraC family transcriptional regulator [Paraprevotella sp.]|nr:AraC family transcriptional regulator [Paraprevotella sp.]
MEMFFNNKSGLLGFLSTNLNYFKNKPIVSDRFMIVLVESGSATLKIGDKTIYIDNQMLLTLPPRVIIEYIANESSADCAIKIIGVEPAMGPIRDTRTDFDFILTIFKQISWKLDEKIKKIAIDFFNIVEYVTNDENNSMRHDVLDYLLIAFLRFFQSRIKHMYSNAKEQSNMNSQNILMKFLNLVREHHTKDHRVAFYADQLCISAKYLTQITKQTTRKTPKELIDRYLANESLTLLYQHHYTIQEISNKLGFPDQSYFGRFFKRMFGISPLHYRQNPEKLSREMLKM